MMLVTRNRESTGAEGEYQMLVTPNIPDEELLTVKEVAQALCVSPSTIRRWVKLRCLKGINVSPLVPGISQRQTYRIPRYVLAGLLDMITREQILGKSLVWCWDHYEERMR